MALKFEYCECGCKGYSAEGFPYWIFWDLKDKYYLHLGHGISSMKVGVYSSLKQAEGRATELANKTLDKLKKALED